jgi:hypothetical protein
LEQVAKDGKKRKIKFYNLDMIIAVGYRINSKKATNFRRWATKVLKEYIHHGYTINSQKITVNRFTNLENEVKDLKKAVKNIKEDKKELQISRGVFYEGQAYDAYVLINDIFKTAKSEIVLIDNYIDDMVLTLFSKYPNLNSYLIFLSLDYCIEFGIF